MGRMRKLLIPGVDKKLLVKDALKVMPDLSRRRFIAGGASLGALTVAPDIVVVADRTKRSVPDVARTYIAAVRYFRLERIVNAAREIAVQSRMTHNPKREHEDDFLYVAFLMQRYFLSPPPDAPPEDAEAHDQAQQQRLEPPEHQLCRWTQASDLLTARS